jgi:hypothetical protein
MDKTAHDIARRWMRTLRNEDYEALRAIPANAVEIMEKLVDALDKACVGLNAALSTSSEWWKIADDGLEAAWAAKRSLMPVLFRFAIQTTEDGWRKIAQWIGITIMADGSAIGR